MNPSSETRLTKVHPELARLVHGLYQVLLLQGMTIVVVQGLRTFAEQDVLFAQGRTRPGPIVTRARGGQSEHNYGIAVDVAPLVSGQDTIDWNNTAAFLTIGAEAVKLGLEWGGNWLKFVDKPHVQLPAPKLPLLLPILKANGVAAVWKYMDARAKK